MAVEQLPNLGQHEAQVIGLRFHAHAERGLEQDLVAAAEILKIDGRHGAVRYCDQGSLFGPYARGSQPDILDDAGPISEAADVAHAEHFVAQHRHAAEKILDRLLRTESNREAADS